ncbi:MAG: hypothetical protein U9O66_03445 [Patescibacteria group bacterium]|nr:hypothetical protein [Patescibacteria group bacterium]
MNKEQISYQSAIEDAENISAIENSIKEVGKLEKQGFTSKEAARLYSLEKIKNNSNFVGFSKIEKKDYKRLKRKSSKYSA